MSPEEEAEIRQIMREEIAAALAHASADEWCRDENCQYRNWRSGFPNHKRGTGCPLVSVEPVPADEPKALRLDPEPMVRRSFRHSWSPSCSAGLACKFYPRPGYEQDKSRYGVTA